MRDNDSRLNWLVNVPEILNRFDELDFDISFDTGHVARAHDPADYVASTRIRKDYRLSDRQIARAAQYSAVIKHYDSPALFTDRLECTARFCWQASDRYAQFQADRIRARGLRGFVLRIRRLGCGFARAGRIGGIFGRQRHGRFAEPERACPYFKRTSEDVIFDPAGNGGYGT